MPIHSKHLVRICVSVLPFLHIFLIISMYYGILNSAWEIKGTNFLSQTINKHRELHKIKCSISFNDRREHFLSNFILFFFLFISYYLPHFISVSFEGRSIFSRMSTPSILSANHLSILHDLTKIMHWIDEMAAEIHVQSKLETKSRIII